MTGPVTVTAGEGLIDLKTLLAMLGLALVGGLILNLMPCVLPVLSLKLLALIGYAGAERRGARLGLLATAAGVVASFGVLAAALILLKAAGAAIGWGIQFQLPWFLAGMALATTLFAASLWDWLPFGLPAVLAGAVGSVRGRRFTDAFLLGAFATLLATSCSAPLVGTALGFALARGPLDIALVFAALGVGMAAPYLAVAAAPGFVAWLPRPGPWMVWLRRGLGVPRGCSPFWHSKPACGPPWLPARRSRSCWRFSPGGIASPPGDVRPEPPQSRWLSSRCWSPRCTARPCPSIRRRQTSPPIRGARSMKRRRIEW